MDGNTHDKGDEAWTPQKAHTPRSSPTTNRGEGGEGDTTEEEMWITGSPGNGQEETRHLGNPDVQSHNSMPTVFGKAPTTVDGPSCNSHSQPTLKITIPARLTSFVSSSRRTQTGGSAESPHPRKKSRTEHTAESTFDELDSSGLNGSYWSSNSSKTRRRPANVPPWDLRERPKLKRLRRYTRSTRAKIARDGLPASSQNLTIPSEVPKIPDGRRRSHPRKCSAISSYQSHDDDNESDTIASDPGDPDFVVSDSGPSPQDDHDHSAPQAIPSPSLDSLCLEYPFHRRSIPPLPRGSKAALESLDPIVPQENSAPRRETLVDNPTSVSDGGPLQALQGQDSVTLASPKNPNTNTPSSPTTPKSTHSSDPIIQTGSPQDASSNAVQIQNANPDREQLSLMTVELVSSIGEMKSDLEEKTAKVKDLEENVNELHAEMDFVKDLLKWEKKKLAKEKASMQTEMELWAKEKEQSDFRLKRFQEERIASERESEALRKRLKYLESGVEHLKMKLEESHSVSSLGSTPPALSAASPIRDGENDREPIRQTYPPSTKRTQAKPGMMGSLILTEVASWSAMSILLEQTSLVLVNDDPRQPSRQELMDKMVGLCTEREKFLFKFSGALALGYTANPSAGEAQSRGLDGGECGEGERKTDGMGRSGGAERGGDAVQIDNEVRGQDNEVRVGHLEPMLEEVRKLQPKKTEIGNVRSRGGVENTVTTKPPSWGVSSSSSSSKSSGASGPLDRLFKDDKHKSRREATSLRMNQLPPVSAERNLEASATLHNSQDGISSSSLSYDASTPYGATHFQTTLVGGKLNLKRSLPSVDLANSPSPPLSLPPRKRRVAHVARESLEGSGDSAQQTSFLDRENP